MSAAPRLDLTGGRLRVSGNITTDNAVGVRGEGERMIAGQGTAVVVDLSGLGEVHSVVLSVLLCWLRFAHARNQRLVVEGAGERFQSLAALSGVKEPLSRS